MDLVIVFSLDDILCSVILVSYDESVYDYDFRMVTAV